MTDSRDLVESYSSSSSHQEDNLHVNPGRNSDSLKDKSEQSISFKEMRDWNSPLENSKSISNESVSFRYMYRKCTKIVIFHYSSSLLVLIVDLTFFLTTNLRCSYLSSLLEVSVEKNMKMIGKKKIITTNHLNQVIVVN